MPLEPIEGSGDARNFPLAGVCYSSFETGIQKSGRPEDMEHVQFFLTMTVRAVPLIVFRKVLKVFSELQASCSLATCLHWLGTTSIPICCHLVFPDDFHGSTWLPEGRTFISA